MKNTAETQTKSPIKDHPKSPIKQGSNVSKPNEINKANKVDATSPKVTGESPTKMTLQPGKKEESQSPKKSNLKIACTNTETVSASPILQLSPSSVKPNQTPESTPKQSPSKTDSDENLKRKLDNDHKTPIKKLIVEEETPVKLEKPTFSGQGGFSALAGSKTDFSKLLKKETPLTPSKNLAKQVEELGIEKKKYVKQEVITGEEDEVAIDSFRCKLFYFPNEGDTWKERGVGSLKISLINDKNYRLVMRNDGVFRVILNVRIQEKMPIKLRNENFIEFIAVEDGQLRKFLLRLKNGQLAKKAYDSMIEVIPTALEK